MIIGEQSVGCGMWMRMRADCAVGDGSVMDVRMQKIECEREFIFIFIFIFHGFGVANLFLMFTKYKAFHWSRVHLPTMCGLTVTVKK